MKQIKLFLSLFLVTLLSVAKLNAQIVEGTPCTATCLDPNKSTITGKNPNPNGVSPNLNLPCGSGTTEDNPGWWIIRPSGNKLTYTVQASNCVGGGLSIQMTLWEGDNCGSVSAIDCVVGTSGVLTANVTPCKIYYLQVDGTAESQCNVTVTYDKNQILKEVPAPTITGPMQLCKGATAKFTASLPSLPGCRPDSWTWTIEPANAGTATKVAGSPDDINIKITNPPPSGKVKVCVEPKFTGKCPPKVNKQCKEVDIIDLKPATCDIELCPEDRPYIYELIKCIKTTNPTFSGTFKPETYTINFPPGTKKTQKIPYTVDGTGCASDVTLNITIFDNKPVQLPPLILCKNDKKTIKGVDFDCADAGAAPKKFTKTGNPLGSGQRSCDTTFEMLVQCIRITPKITGVGTLDCSTTQLTLNAGGAGTVVLPNSIKLTSYEGVRTLSYKWFKDNVEIVGQTGPTLLVTAPGVYKVELSCKYEVSQTINGVPGKWSNTCTETTEVVINGIPGNAVAETPVPLSTPCANGTAKYNIVPDPNAEGYQWVVKGATIISKSENPNGLVEVEVKNNGTPYQVCLIKKACAKTSAENCIDVTPIPAPVKPIIAGANPVCQGDSTKYSVSNPGSFSTDVKYSWKVTDGTIASSNADNSEIYINWSKTAISGTVTLIVEEPCGKDSSTITVAINNLPEKPKEISGKKVVCIGDVTNYTVTPAKFATSYEWTLSDGGKILGNNTGTTISVEWDKVGGPYQLCVKSINNCLPTGSEFYCIDIEVKPIPSANAGNDRKVCGDDLKTILKTSVSANGNTGKWSLATGAPGTANFANANTDSTEVSVSACGVYEFVWTESNGICSNTDTVAITFSTPPKAKTISYSCQPATKSYTVTIELEGCNAPFSLISSKYPGVLTGNVIVISNVPDTARATWQVVVANSQPCLTTLNLTTDCNCITKPGIMDLTATLTACEKGGSITAKHKTGTEVNDGNDQGAFVLHEGSGNAIVNQLAINLTGTFTFDPTKMQCGKVYYVSYVIGDKLNTGLPNFLDKCFQVVPQGQPVKWDCVPDPSASVISVDTCNLSAILKAEPGISGEWSILGGKSGTFIPNSTAANAQCTGLSFGTTIFVWTETNGTCSDTAQTSITITKKGNLSYDVDTLCADNGKNYQLVFTLKGGIGYKLNNTSTVTGTWASNVFTTDPIVSGTKVKVCFEDDLTCQPTCQEFEPSCPCTSNAGQMSQSKAEACVDGKINVSIPPASSGLYLDSDDIGEFYLHTTNGSNNKLGTVIAHNITGEFTFIPPMVAGTVYYVSYVVGDKSSTNPNEVDLTDKCLSVSLGQPVVFYPLPTLLAKDNSTICEGSSTTINYTLTGSSPFNITYTENGIAGTLKDINDKNYVQSVKPNVTTTYAYNKITDANGCSSNLSQNIVVTVNKPVSAGVFGEDRKYCFGEDETVNLEVELTGQDAGGVWTVDNPVAGFDASTATFATKNAAVGSHKFTYTVQGKAPCPNQSASFVVTINPIPKADAGPDIDLNCDLEQATLGGNSSVGASIEYQWLTLSGALLQNPNSKNPITTKAGTFELTVKDNITGCFSKDIVEVTNNVTNITDFANKIVEPTCFGEDNGIIDVTQVQGGTAPFYYSINNGPYVPYRNFVNLKSGIYNISIKDAKGCKFQKDVTVTEPEEITVSLGDKNEDVVLELGADYTLEAVLSPPNFILKKATWTPTCDSCLTAPKDKSLTYYAKPGETTLYTITVVNDKGCVAKDNKLIRVNKPRRVYIPNIFSPNAQETENRKLRVYLGIDVAKVHYFRVYDRWGNAIHEENNFTLSDVNNGDTGWDGKYRGQVANPGVYTYGCLVEFVDGYKELYKGDILLIEK